MTGELSRAEKYFPDSSTANKNIFRDDEIINMNAPLSETDYG